MHKNCTNNFYHVEQDSECDAYFANNSFFFQILHSISRKCSGTSLLKLKGIEVDFVKTIKEISKH